MSDDQLLGGERALIGFYFQMIVTLGIGAITSTQVRHDVADGERDFILDKLPVANVLTTLVPEQFGQDLTVANGGIVTLLQMKYSGSLNEIAMGETDFKKILRGFASSHLNVLAKNLTPADHFGIVSNRDATDPLTQIQEHVTAVRGAITVNGEVSADPSIIGSATLQTSEGKTIGTLREWVIDALTIRKEKKTPVPPSRDLVEAALYVFPRVLFILDIPLQDWRDKFYKYAARFGATIEETDEAERLLLGKLMQPAGVSYTLTKTDLVQAITRYPSALDLTPEGVGSPCVAAWKEKAHQNNIDKDWIISRNIQDLNSLLRTKKIIFIMGDGGCGKSVLLKQVTESVIFKLEKLEAVNDWDGFAILQSCHDVQEDIIERHFGKWGRRGAVGSSVLDIPLERLEIANPNKNILLWIGLDGLDEHFPYEAALRRLVQTAKERNDLRIIFSCRSDSRPRVTAIFDRNDTGDSRGTENDPFIGEITVPDFFEYELLDAIEKGAGEEARERVEQSLDAESRSLGGAGLPPADPVIVASLTHPRLFGAFMNVVTSDKSLLMPILNAEPSALLLVARSFLIAFFKKYSDRRRERSFPEEGELAYHLKALCTVQQVRDEGIFDLSLWETVYSKEIGNGSAKARLLLKECIAGGLIAKNGDQERYRWRHDFVANCLASDPIGSYCNE